MSDDGRGIDAENLGRVFELFFQADPGMARAAGGLGIGLTLVQRLASLHGGVVRASSAGIGKGASFTVRIPAIAAPAQAGVGLAETRPVPALDILIVEDKPDERRSLRMLLELHGHRVREAADSVAALEMLHGWHPAAAILDIGLPGGLDGYQLAREMRAQFGTSIALDRAQRLRRPRVRAARARGRLRPPLLQAGRVRRAAAVGSFLAPRRAHLPARRLSSGSGYELPRGGVTPRSCRVHTLTPNSCRPSSSSSPTPA